METNGPKRSRVRDQLNSLKHFQQHSRLHFIGQWKTKAHDLFKEWFAENPAWNHGVLDRQAIFAHLDMDAFFCSVVLARDENAHLRDKPVCVAAGRGNSDISSCNYVARSFGVRAGMYVNAARVLCPDLRVLSYDLERSGEVAMCLYRMIFELCPAHLTMSVEVYSVDEVMIAFDTDSYEAVEDYCNEVRRELEAATKCTVSCGIGPNVMLARIATQSAKPDGTFIVRPEDVTAIVSQLPFSEIHGAGSSTIAKLVPLLGDYLGDMEGVGEENILCQHVQKLTKQQLQRVLGQKTGENFYNLCRGNDVRLVTRTGDEENQRLMGKRTRASIGCSMNYAVRPKTVEDVWSIARQLLDVVCAKMGRGPYCCSGLRVTILERHPLHPKETLKYMGRGKCLEFHIPVNFSSVLKSCDMEIMLACVERALGPLLVLGRTMRDEERVEELGLQESTKSGIIWTVGVDTITDIVIEDIRGMSIQATTVRLEHDGKDTPKHTTGVQLSLADAFSKRASNQKGSLVNGGKPAKRPPSSSGDSIDFLALDDLMNHNVDDSFVSEWKKLAVQAGKQVDYTTLKALIRIAALRCAESPKPSGEMKELFRTLVSFAQGLLPHPVAFT
ncbi:DNA damage repair protein, putative [Trypanosoma brucei gambiense DAL972]|uniref:DNA damage repair protein, putative n=1 Tax=Trypanosoma brucei gambiense (strain MHOM/CI/86/DAL972) TaxID=679716 RepID=D0A2H2_TRYB9|nr:DNA damage repair protein, putative [Trypanosoma brucei gambiense DAL972]CBH15466.1 DNA damage repair protein, putative [Trypanosoma brucei gambiense DAL972]|eukprot:XP_011777730.1 DNA damage repair protein, putative [Trypanosoma brucei gambiense DAL972]